MAEPRYEDLQVPRCHVFAHRLGGHFIVADGAHHAAPRALERQLREPEEEHQHNS